MRFPKPLLGLMSLLICLDAAAQFSVVPCPDAVLSSTPNAACVVRSSFSFQIFGAMPAATPTQACAIAATQLTKSANIPTACEFSPGQRSCSCEEEGGGFQSSWPVTEDAASLLPMCPPEFTGMPQIRVPVTGADGFPANLAVCVSKTQNVPAPEPDIVAPPPGQPEPCPVPPLRALTDPVALQHERGRYAGVSDLEHLAEPTMQAQRCLLARADKSEVFPVSGYLPSEFQAHLKEVWDAWHALRNNNSPACKKLKDATRLEWLKHKLVRPPQLSPQHAAGNAIDITGLAASSVDSAAAYCGMVRPDPQTSPLHFQPANK